MKKIVKELIPYIIIVTIVILIRSYIIDPVRVSGDSMYNTLNDGEILLLNRLDYHFNTINRYDIVVVKSDNEKIIKRVIGLPGEHVKYKYGNLYINNEIYHDDFSKETASFDLTELGYDTIPEGKYLVLGDNREISKDSRIIGLVDKKDILGSTSIRIWPLTKFGKIKIIKNDN